MLRLLDFINDILNIYIYILVATAVMSWLVSFQVINLRNSFAYNVNRTLYQLTEPALRPLRRILPPLGSLDISFFVLMFGIFGIQKVVIGNLMDYFSRL